MEQARSRIAEPSRWCRADEAQRRFHPSSSPFHPDAMRYCALGSLYRAGFLRTLAEAAARALPHGAARALTGIDDGEPATGELAIVNDCDGRAAVFSVFDKLLERADLPLGRQLGRQS